MTISKPFTPDMKTLEDEFMSEANKVKRTRYRENHTKTEKKFIYDRWQYLMLQLGTNISFFEYLEKYHSQNLSCQVLTNVKWNTSDKKSIRASHPPPETITVSHKGSEVIAPPFKIQDLNSKKQLAEQNNYTNQYL